MSPDGRYIAYDFSAIPPYFFADRAFVRDRLAGTVTDITENDDAFAVDGQDPHISGDGRFVAYNTNPSGGTGQTLFRDRDTDEDGVYDETGQAVTIQLGNGRPEDITLDAAFVLYGDELYDVVAQTECRV